MARSVLCEICPNVRNGAPDGMRERCAALLRFESPCDIVDRRIRLVRAFSHL